MSTKKITKRNKFKDKDTDYYSDDCAICGYMKEMERKGAPETESGIKLAFEKQRQKDGVVGGSGFDKEESKN